MPGDRPGSLALLAVLQVEATLGELQVPVTELAPDELVQATRRLVVAKTLEVAGRLAHHVVQPGQEPAIEAATIDGAGPWKRFWSIVFPLLSPTTFFLLVINIVYAFFDTFGIIDATTEGGPGQSTSILVYKVYQDGFKALDLGGSAAQSVILMVIVVTLTVVQFRYVEKKVQY